MKNYIKLAVLLTLALTLCAMFCSCSGNVTDSNGISYSLNKENNTYTVVSYKGSSADLIIPDKHEGLPVTAIGVGAFSGNTTIKSVKIPSSITVIGSTAFRGCSSLTTVEFEEGSLVEEIESGVFSGCTLLNDVVLPDSVKIIGYKAFEGCTGMTTISFPKSLEEIRYFAFSNCATLKDVTINSSFTVYANAFAECRDLTMLATPEDGAADATYKYNKDTGLLTDASETVLVKFLQPGYNTYTIPASITSITDGAFYEQFDLSAINVDSGNTAYIAKDGILYTADMKTLVAFPAGKKDAADFEVPDGVEKIANYAFCGTSNITSVKLPESVNGIGSCAFKGCSKLKSLVTGSGKISVGAGAFDGCKLLASYRVADKDKTLPLMIEGRILFSENGQKLYSYPAELEAESYTIPASVTEIADGAFALNTRIKSFAVSDGNTTLCVINGALYSADKKIIYAYPAANTATEFKTESTVEKICAWAFASNVHLKSVELAKPTEALTEHCFEGCTSLETLTILALELDIRQNALEGCTALKVINFAGNEASWKSASDNASSGNAVIDSITPNCGYKKAEK